MERENSVETQQQSASWPEHNLPSLPANNFAVGKVGDFVYLTFGELRPFSAGTPAIRPVGSMVLGTDGHKALTHLLAKALETEDLKELAAFIAETLQERR